MLQAEKKKLMDIAQRLRETHLAFNGGDPLSKEFRGLKYALKSIAKEEEEL